MNFECHADGSRHVLQIKPRLDVNAAPEFETRLMAAIDDGARHLIIDLSELQYISSAGLRSIISISRLLKSLEGSLSLCGAHGIVNDVFVMSGLAGAFPFFATLEEAMK